MTTFDTKLTQALLTEEKHKYATTHIPITGPLKKQILNYANNIPDNHLTNNGRENNIHCTIKYGLHTNDPEEIRKAIKTHTPITITLGKITHFNNEEHDVLKIDIQSPDLHKLNKTISKAINCTDTHPTYKPHITIAYLKKGKAKEYTGDNRFQGKELQINKITFSDKEKNETTIPLTTNQTT